MALAGCSMVYTHEDIEHGLFPEGACYLRHFSLDPVKIHISGPTSGVINLLGLTWVLGCFFESSFGIQIRIPPQVRGVDTTKEKFKAGTSRE